MGCILANLAAMHRDGRGPQVTVSPSSTCQSSPSGWLALRTRDGRGRSTGDGAEAPLPSVRHARPPAADRMLRSRCRAGVDALGAHRRRIVGRSRPSMPGINGAAVRGVLRPRRRRRGRSPAVDRAGCGVEDVQRRISPVCTTTRGGARRRVRRRLEPMAAAMIAIAASNPSRCIALRRPSRRRRVPKDGPASPAGKLGQRQIRPASPGLRARARLFLRTDLQTVAWGRVVAVAIAEIVMDRACVERGPCSTHLDAFGLSMLARLSRSRCAGC